IGEIVQDDRDLIFGTCLHTLLLDVLRELRRVGEPSSDRARVAADGLRGDTLRSAQGEETACSLLLDGEAAHTAASFGLSPEWEVLAREGTTVYAALSGDPKGRFFGFFGTRMSAQELSRLTAYVVKAP